MRIVAVALAATLATATLGGGLVAQARIPLGLGGSAQELPTLSPLLKSVTPSVVSIATRGRLTEAQRKLLSDPKMRELFGLPEMPLDREMYAGGSGVIIDVAQGLIVTGNHVVENADDIVVTLGDDRKLAATLVGRDPETDIAVIKINANRLTAIAFADSDALEVGDFVIAVGNPFSFGQTVTSGIVGALHRRGLGLQAYEDFIQTDASINPGSSGGALINLRGELVGLNAAMVGGDLGGNAGIGFAIPANMVRSIADQLVKFGVVSHGQLGVTVQRLSPELMQMMRLPVGPGVLVTNVEKGSSAERGGLTIGDVITNVNAMPVQDPSALRNRIGMIRAGDQVTLDIYRGGERKIVSITLAPVPVRKGNVNDRDRPPPAGGAVRS